jgi:hypothetical protein
VVTYNKFQDFVEQLGLGTHNLNTDLLKLMLVNSPAPVATNSLKADLTEIGAGNGYTAGGEDSTNTWAESGGTATLTGTKIVWTASGGSIGPFQYAVLYNDTAGSKNLVGWWNYGSALTLNTGETFTVKFNDGDPTGDILTLV